MRLSFSGKLGVGMKWTNLARISVAVSLMRDPC